MSPDSPDGPDAPGDLDRTRWPDVRAYGDAAVLVEPARPADVLPLRDALRARGWAGELVPAATTLLAGFDPAATDAAAVYAAVRAAAEGLAGAAAEPVPGPLVELPVRYDGADLDAVAAEVGSSTAELIERHCAAEYTVAFCGFAPGFAYLRGLPPRLHVARLATPRTAVPAGSVGIAGGFTGVYPRASPGGWRLLGRTAARLWDLDRTPPALLTPGTRVRFVPA